jgi:hypothetical protein
VRGASLNGALPPKLSAAGLVHLQSSVYVRSMLGTGSAVNDVGKRLTGDELVCFHCISEILAIENGCQNFRLSIFPLESERPD